MPKRMAKETVDAALTELPGWSSTDGTDISRTFSFADHIAAVGFVVRVAMAAEVMDHHPDLRIVYNRVEIHLSSHDAGGVTDRDIRLASKIDAYA